MPINTFDLVMLLRCFAIICAGMLFIPFACQRLNLNVRYALVLYVWHTLFCVVGIAYVLNYGGDALFYYQHALRGDVSLGLGIHSIFYLTTILVNWFDFSLIEVSLFYNIIGTIGLFAFAAALQFATKNADPWLGRVAKLIVFLPSVSFWTAGLGKDSIAFLSVGLALWASIALNQRKILALFAITMMLIIRPHIACLMLFGFVLAVMFDKSVSKQVRVLLACLAFIVFVGFTPLAIQYIGYNGELSLSGVKAFIQMRQGHNLLGGSSIDISQMNIFMQVYTYLFRPGFFDANSLTFFAAAIDNSVLFLLFVAGITRMLFVPWQHYQRGRVFMLSYAVTLCIINATTTANLGIALRQKWMFLPMLIFLLILVLNVRQHKESTL